MHHLKVSCNSRSLPPAADVLWLHLPCQAHSSKHLETPCFTPVGVSHLPAILTPVALILLAVILGLWWFRRKRGRLRRQGDVTLAEIPGAERSGERGQMISAGTDTEGAGPADEGVPMRPSDCATSTG
uniref:Uncharacterized protein n=1 Tax=Sphaerodactylus townsendi TaxID=933632 RepID=A0ACB8FLW1_9SAUR